MSIRNFVQIVLALIVVTGIAVMGLSAGMGDRVSAQETDIVAMQAAVEQALATRPTDLFPGDTLLDSDISIEGDWALVPVSIFQGQAKVDIPSAGLLVLVHRTSGEWTAAIQGTDLFDQWLPSVPSALLTTDAKSYLYSSQVSLQYDATLQLSLPYAKGESWCFSGGPHSTNRSSVDFAKADGVIRAAAPGTVSINRSCPNQVVIHHGNGWQTSYYHVSGISVPNGKVINRGEKLGIASMEHGCGGSASGDHVHFSLLRNGVKTSIHDKVVGGWLVRQGNADYKGSLKNLKTNAIVNPNSYCPQSAYVYNNGTIGDGSSVGTQTTFQSIITSGQENGKTSIFLRVCGSGTSYQIGSQRGKDNSWLGIWSKSGTGGCSPNSSSGWRVVMNADIGASYYIYSYASSSALSQSNFINRARKHKCTITSVGKISCNLVRETQSSLASSGTGELLFSWGVDNRDTMLNDSSLGNEVFTLPNQDQSAATIEYMLEGVDTDWLPAEIEQTSVTYDGLSEGSYTFRLRITDSTGFQSITEMKETVGTLTSQPLSMCLPLIVAP